MQTQSQQAAQLAYSSATPLKTQESRADVPLTP